MSVYLFADHHAGGGYPQRGIDDSAAVMDWLVAWALHDVPQWVISLGDAVDAIKMTPAAPVTLKNQLRQLADADIKVGYIDGNHDRHGAVSWLDDPDFIHLDSLRVEIAGRLWMGLDYGPREEIQRVLAETIPADVTGLLMHQAWGELLHWDTNQCSFDQVPAQVTSVLTGDYHGQCLITWFRGKGGQNILVGNPGSTSVQDISEPGDKYYLVLHNDGTLERRPLPARPLLRSDALHTQADLERFLARVRTDIEAAVARADRAGVPESMRKPLLQVRYDVALVDAVRRIERLVGTTAYLFWKEMRPDPEGGQARSRGDRAGAACTPLSLLKETFAGKRGPLDLEVFALAERLLLVKTKEQVQQLLAEWRDQRLATEEEACASSP